MFSAIESAVIAHLAGCIPNVPVLGTYDQADLAAPDIDRLAMQVEYQGFDALENKPGIVTLAHRLAVHVLIDAGRARPDERALAETGLHAAIQRLLAWPDRTQRVEIQSSPSGQTDGRVLRLSVQFSVSPAVIAAA